MTTCRAGAAGAVAVVWAAAGCAAPTAASAPSAQAASADRTAPGLIFTTPPYLGKIHYPERAVVLLARRRVGPGVAPDLWNAAPGRLAPTRANRAHDPRTGAPHRVTRSGRIPVDRDVAALARHDLADQGGGEVPGAQVGQQAG